MIEFFFDCSSPWTYLAFRNVQPLAAELKIDINWRPVLVGGIFNSVNKAMYASREDKTSPKNRYAMKDLQDCARATGVRITFPPKVFPVNSVKAMRGCLWIAQDAAAQQHYTAFVESTFAAYFTRQEDISQDAVLANLCLQNGIDAEAFLAGIARPDIKEALKANTDEVIRRGGFGSPTIFVGDDMYFGNDRLPLVKAAVLAARKQGS
ncbi:MAG: 2-hydroxychromene-2-carboxylate isomerase [Polaromonas sp.]|nr:2-hydroxychromene-2-carboxylate isomerase [Polaromonas sp.]